MLSWDFGASGAMVGQLVAALLPGRGRLDTPYEAYRVAWRVADRDGCWDETVLRQELKDGNVPGAYDPDADPVLSVYLERWRRRVHPRDVPRHER